MADRIEGSRSRLVLSDCLGGPTVPDNSGKGFAIPVEPEENISVEGKILVEICKRDKYACNQMIANRNGANYHCALLLWSEAVQ